ncbi:YciI family protein [Marinicella sp. W31]|uniref:YciI family protein n=1 Tax=Marinicella sp. W31 TaxID=3023713 RepID=UPI003757F685
MLFAIISTDVENSLEKRMPVRDLHIERLKHLESAGRLLIAGPHPVTDELEPEQPAFSGSLVVAEFESLQAAQQWADADPYVDAGVYAQVMVKPFIKVLPV